MIDFGIILIIGILSILIDNYIISFYINLSGFLIFINIIGIYIIVNELRKFIEKLVFRIQITYRNQNDNRND